jgi:hypothetical protein
MIGMKKVLAIICHSRPELLENCLGSLFRTTGIQSYELILIQQVGNSAVSDVVRRHKSEFDIVIEVKRSGNPTQNISKNRYLAYQTGFDHFSADFMVVLEDDVQISGDSLLFAESIFEKFKNQSDFRGFNFGSGIPYTPENLETFSKVRYALQGPASLMPKRTWRHYDPTELLKKAEYEIFDGTIETYIQSGFVVMPNTSRYCDFGFTGTHSTGDPTTGYFTKLADSWVGLNSQNTVSPRESYLDQNWRRDCIKYKRWQNIYFRLRDWAVFHRENKFINGLLQLVRRLKANRGAS